MMYVNLLMVQKVQSSIVKFYMIKKKEIHLDIREIDKTLIKIFPRRQMII